MIVGLSGREKWDLLGVVWVPEIKTTRFCRKGNSTASAAYLRLKPLLRSLNQIFHRCMGLSG